MAIQSVIVGKMGLAVFVKCRVGESVCIFGHMHMKRCPLQTYIRTEGLNSLLRLSKKQSATKCGTEFTPTSSDGKSNQSPHSGKSTSTALSKYSTTSTITLI